MRVMIMFDLPVTSAAERREYAHFRKLLIKNGFIMMQESIYTKLVQNESAARWAVDTVRKNKPKDGPGSCSYGEAVCENRIYPWKCFQ